MNTLSTNAGSGTGCAHPGGQCRWDFPDPPTYNLDTEKHRHYIMGNDKRN